MPLSVGEGELGRHITCVDWAEAYVRTRWLILIHPTIWPQYTNVADMQTDRHTDRRQRSRSLGRTVTCNGRPKISGWV